MPRSALLLDGQALLDADRLLRSGLAERRASFELSIRRMPAHAGFAVVAGVQEVVELARAPLVDATEIEHARRVCGLSDALVERLTAFAPKVDIDAVPEGTIAFADEPIASVEGGLFDALLVGRALQASVQRATSIATRAARLHIASEGEPVVEASSMRVISPDASLAIARAAFVGGAAASTNPLACAALGIPFRAEARLELGALAQGTEGAPSSSSPADGWGASPSDRLVDLGAGDDEEAVLVEAKRLRTQAGGWLARGLADGTTLPSLRLHLVAYEEAGAWSPRRGTSGAADVVPGRKRVARYIDEAGRMVADVVHLNNERMQSARAVGAVKLVPFSQTVLRGGRTLEAHEPVTVARERAIAGRRTLPPQLLYLRRPAAFRIELSDALKALAERRR